jgi:hypothetical protein
MLLKFNDGVKIETSGKLRKLKLKDGWYVVGNGNCIPVFDEAEADWTLQEMMEEEWHYESLEKHN